MRRIKDNHPKKSVEGIGISVPGRVDKESQCLIFAPNLKWPRYDIKQAIEHGMGLPTEMENAATACLMSELWFGRMDGARDAVLITISEGIGAGILANGQLISGQTEWRVSLGTFLSIPPVRAAPANSTVAGKFWDHATLPCAISASWSKRSNT